VKKIVPPLFIENFPMIPKAWMCHVLGDLNAPKQTHYQVLIVGSYKKNLKI
jgi:hypothetical protein